MSKKKLKTKNFLYIFNKKQFKYSNYRNIKIKCILNSTANTLSLRERRKIVCQLYNYWSIYNNNNKIRSNKLR